MSPEDFCKSRVQRAIVLITNDPGAGHREGPTVSTPFIVPHELNVSATGTHATNAPFSAAGVPPLSLTLIHTCARAYTHTTNS